MAMLMMVMSSLSLLFVRNLPHSGRLSSYSVCTPPHLRNRLIKFVWHRLVFISRAKYINKMREKKYSLLQLICDENIVAAARNRRGCKCVSGFIWRMDLSVRTYLSILFKQTQNLRRRDYTRVLFTFPSIVRAQCSFFPLVRAWVYHFMGPTSRNSA